MLEDLLREEILEHFRNPSNYGRIENAVTIEGANPLCGDEFKIYLLVEGDTISDIKFEGRGCSISTASASIMTESIKGLNIMYALKKALSFKDFMTKKSEVNDSEFEILKGVRSYPVRIKCALLAWEILIEYLNGRKY